MSRARCLSAPARRPNELGAKSGDKVAAKPCVASPLAVKGRAVRQSEDGAAGAGAQQGAASIAIAQPGVRPRRPQPAALDLNNSRNALDFPGRPNLAPIRTRVDASPAARPASPRANREVGPGRGPRPTDLAAPPPGGRVAKSALPRRPSSGAPAASQQRFQPAPLPYHQRLRGLLDGCKPAAGTALQLNPQPTRPPPQAQPQPAPAARVAPRDRRASAANQPVPAAQPQPQPQPLPQQNQAPLGGRAQPPARAAAAVAMPVVQGKSMGLCPPGARVDKPAAPAGGPCAVYRLSDDGIRDAAAAATASQQRQQDPQHVQGQCYLDGRPGPEWLRVDAGGYGDFAATAAAVELEVEPPGWGQGQGQWPAGEPEGEEEYWEWLFQEKSEPESPYGSDVLRALLSAISPRFAVKRPEGYVPVTPSDISSGRYVRSDAWGWSCPASPGAAAALAPAAAAPATAASAGMVAGASQSQPGGDPTAGTVLPGAASSPFHPHYHSPAHLQQWPQCGVASPGGGASPEHPHFRLGRRAVAALAAISGCPSPARPLHPPYHRPHIVGGAQQQHLTGVRGSRPLSAGLVEVTRSCGPRPKMAVSASTAAAPGAAAGASGVPEAARRAPAVAEPVGDDVTVRGSADRSAQGAAPREPQGPSRSASWEQPSSEPRLAPALEPRPQQPVAPATSARRSVDTAPRERDIEPCTRSSAPEPQVQTHSADVLSLPPKASAAHGAPRHDSDQGQGQGRDRDQDRSGGGQVYVRPPCGRQAPGPGPAPGSQSSSQESAPGAFLGKSRFYRQASMAISTATRLLPQEQQREEQQQRQQEEGLGRQRQPPSLNQSMSASAAEPGQLLGTGCWSGPDLTGPATRELSDPWQQPSGPSPSPSPGGADTDRFAAYLASPESSRAAVLSSVRISGLVERPTGGAPSFEGTAAAEAPGFTAPVPPGAPAARPDRQRHGSGSGTGGVPPDGAIGTATYPVISPTGKESAISPVSSSAAVAESPGLPAISPQGGCSSCSRSPATPMRMRARSQSAGACPALPPPSPLSAAGKTPPGGAGLAAQAFYTPPSSGPRRAPPAVVPLTWEPPPLPPSAPRSNLKRHTYSGGSTPSCPCSPAAGATLRAGVSVAVPAPLPDISGFFFLNETLQRSPTGPQGYGGSPAAAGPGATEALAGAATVEQLAAVRCPAAPGPHAGAPPLVSPSGVSLRPLSALSCSTVDGSAAASADGSAGGPQPLPLPRPRPSRGWINGARFPGDRTDGSHSSSDSDSGTSVLDACGVGGAGGGQGVADPERRMAQVAAAVAAPSPARRRASANVPQAVQQAGRRRWTLPGEAGPGAPGEDSGSPRARPPAAAAPAPQRPYMPRPHKARPPSPSAAVAVAVAAAGRPRSAQRGASPSVAARRPAAAAHAAGRTPGSASRVRHGGPPGSPATRHLQPNSPRGTWRPQEIRSPSGLARHGSPAAAAASSPLGRCGSGRRNNESGRRRSRGNDSPAGKKAGGAGAGEGVTSPRVGTALSRGADRSATATAAAVRARLEGGATGAEAPSSPFLTPQLAAATTTQPSSAAIAPVDPAVHATGVSASAAGPVHGGTISAPRAASAAAAASVPAAGARHDRAGTGAEGAARRASRSSAASSFQVSAAAAAALVSSADSWGTSGSEPARPGQQPTVLPPRPTAATMVDPEGSRIGGSNAVPAPDGQLGGGNTDGVRRNLMLSFGQAGTAAAAAAATNAVVSPSPSSSSSSQAPAAYAPPRPETAVLPRPQSESGSGSGASSLQRQRRQWDQLQQQGASDVDAAAQKRQQQQQQQQLHQPQVVKQVDGQAGRRGTQQQQQQQLEDPADTVPSPEQRDQDRRGAAGRRAAAGQPQAPPQPQSYQRAQSVVLHRDPSAGGGGGVGGGGGGTDGTAGQVSVLPEAAQRSRSRESEAINSAALTSMMPPSAVAVVATGTEAALYAPKPPLPPPRDGPAPVVIKRRSSSGAGVGVGVGAGGSSSSDTSQPPPSSARAQAPAATATAPMTAAAAAMPISESTFAPTAAGLPPPTQRPPRPGARARQPPPPLQLPAAAAAAAGPSPGQPVQRSKSETQGADAGGSTRARPLSAASSCVSADSFDSAGSATPQGSGGRGGGHLHPHHHWSYQRNRERALVLSGVIAAVAQGVPSPSAGVGMGVGVRGVDGGAVGVQLSP